MPQDAFRYFLGAKPFTTAQAEREAEGVDLLAVMAPNTIVLRAPEALLLPEEASLGYSTVHHQNVGSLASEPPDPFWRRVYSVLKVPEERDVHQPNAGRPEDRSVLLQRRQLRRSAGERAAPGVGRRLSEALSGSRNGRHLPGGSAQRVPSPGGARWGGAGTLGEKDVVELPDTYSYPLFFEKFHGGELTFDSLEGVVTMRYEFRVADLPEGWEKEVKGSPEVLTWIRGRFEASGG